MAEPEGTALLFSGHRVDGPERVVPRFPAVAETENRRSIAQAVELESLHHGPISVAIASGASGGDLLFHEICHEVGIRTRLYLPMASAEFVEKSVAPAGDTWTQRFQLVHRRSIVSVMTPQRGSVWHAVNAWMLRDAIAIGGTRTTLIALWDGQPGDGSGGTADMVEAAQRLGIRAQVVEPADKPRGSANGE